MTPARPDASEDPAPAPEPAPEPTPPAEAVESHAPESGQPRRSSADLSADARPDPVRPPDTVDTMEPEGGSTRTQDSAEDPTGAPQASDVAPARAAGEGAGAVPVQPVDARLLTSIERARAAAVEAGGEEAVREFDEVRVEDEHAVTYFFVADQPGYHGWRWAVTLAEGGSDRPVTVSETVLLPGPDALVAPPWVPWQDRVRAGDLGVGDLLPTEPGDPRLVPGYLHSDDAAVEELAHEVGLGRVRVLSRVGREQAAQRWRDGERGPRAEMAKAAPATCATCGFYLPLAGALRAGFGVCGNEYAPADGAVVHAEYGCGAHSDVVAEPGPIAPVAELVYDDGVELERR